jgi:septum formation protein
MYLVDGLILASASPRRKELLATVGLNCSICPADVDESILPGEKAREHATRLSCAKATAIGIMNEPAGRWVIGSDTVVVYEEEILGKPVDKNDARRMLQLLSGSSHQVVTGYAIYDRETKTCTSDATTTSVHFRALTSEDIENYIATTEPFDKAGAYGIQGVAMSFVTSIEGSYPAVVGLPIVELLLLLQKVGALQYKQPKKDLIL